MKIGSILKSHTSGVAWTLPGSYDKRNFSRTFFPNQLFVFAHIRYYDGMEFIGLLDLSTLKFLYPGRYYFNLKFNEIKT